MFNFTFTNFRKLTNLGEIMCERLRGPREIIKVGRGNFGSWNAGSAFERYPVHRLNVKHLGNSLVRVNYAKCVHFIKRLEHLLMLFAAVVV
jgi:hypothetical protein